MLDLKIIETTSGTLAAAEDLCSEGEWIVIKKENV